jgi:hypothetical protein
LEAAWEAAMENPLDFQLEKACWAFAMAWKWEMQSVCVRVLQSALPMGEWDNVSGKQ